MTSLADLIASTHAAIYTYGVVAAFANETGKALDCQAIYRRMRDELIQVAELEQVDVPSAQVAYTLPIRIHNNMTAQAVAAQLENSMCALWADAIANNDIFLNEKYLREPEFAAVRAYGWNHIAHDFPS